MKKYNTQFNITMKKFLILCAFMAGMLTSWAQTAIDNFTVGPYVVDYSGPGDVKYRLRDNIDLYEFFELKRDTTVVESVVETPVRHAIQISGYVGANRFASKEIGLSGVWKQDVGKNLYFNGGLSFAIGYVCSGKLVTRSMFEVGMPLQIELGRLNHQKASLFGTFGIAPTVYTTMMAKIWDGSKYVDADKDKKKTGFLIAPSLEFGGNIPVGDIIMRIGVYGTYKINCTVGNYDVYKNSAGRCFLGAKIGVVF